MHNRSSLHILPALYVSCQVMVFFSFTLKLLLLAGWSPEKKLCCVMFTAVTCSFSNFCCWQCEVWRKNYVYCNMFILKLLLLAGRSLEKKLCYVHCNLFILKLLLLAGWSPENKLCCVMFTVSCSYNSWEEHWGCYLLTQHEVLCYSIWRLIYSVNNMLKHYTSSFITCWNTIPLVL